MTNYFLPGGTSPDYIIGKWDQLGNNLFAEYNNLRVNKYEFWFNTTISFIPYSGESVFITDTSGNVTHTGNLLTKQNTTIDKNLTVKENAIIQKNLTVNENLTVNGEVTVKKDTKIEQDLYVQRVLYIGGQSLSSYVSGMINAAVAPVKSDLNAVKGVAEVASKAAADAAKTAGDATKAAADAAKTAGDATKAAADAAKAAADVKNKPAGGGGGGSTPVPPPTPEPTIIFCATPEGLEMNSPWGTVNMGPLSCQPYEIAGFKAKAAQAASVGMQLANNGMCWWDGFGYFEICNPNTYNT